MVFYPRFYRRNLNNDSFIKIGAGILVFFGVKSIADSVKESVAEAESYSDTCYDNCKIEFENKPASKQDCFDKCYYKYH